MPRLSDTMTEGTVARWLKKPGDPVKRGEPIAEIETDKATMPMEAFEDGTLGPIDVPEGQTVPLGSKIGLLYRAGEAPPAGGATSPVPTAEPASGSGSGSGSGAAAGPRAPTPPTPPAAPSHAAPAVPPAAPPSDGGAPAPAPAATTAPSTEHTAPDQAKTRASPLARRIAAEHDLDLSRVTGTGPGGRIVRADVEELLASQAAGPIAAAGPAPPTAPPAPPAPGEFKPFSRMQAVVARRMVESKTQVPHIYLTTPIDIAAAMRFRAESNAYLGKENGFSVNDLFIRAAALALRKHPIVNAAYREGGLQYNADVNIGNAVSLPGGLVVPVVRHADRKSLPEIGAEMRALAEKARSAGLALADYEGGTFTISNLGMFGVEEFGAIVNPPQAAILAVGAAMQEAVVVDGQVVPGQRCRVTLSADHRVLYGADAAEFLRTLKGYLESPLSLVYG
jgi:pyruvate dehydrogenase E2 component (dihydrolipoamide acetyltransferase)